MSSWWFDQREQQRSPYTRKRLLVRMHRGYLFGLLCIFALVRAGSEVRTDPGAIAERSRWYAPGFAHAVHTIEERIMYVWSPAAQPLPAEEPRQAIELVMQHMRGRSLLLPKQYTKRYELVQEASGFSGDMRSLLGFDRPQTYLVILQNTSEKRPNGWFFGSFAVVEVSRAKVTKFSLVDSYIPAYDRPDVVVRWPSWLEWFLPDRNIYFVSANKVWFTYQDGAHIQELYEKTYPWQRVRGVVFLRTDMFARLLPSFREQQRERQFINAATDLIRKKTTFGKKELYLQDVGEYLREHAGQLIQWMLTHGDAIIEDHMINIYLSRASTAMHKFLRDNRLTTRFEEGMLYAWDSNTSYNKIDEFVEKTITIRNDKGAVLRQSQHDIVPLDEALGITWRQYYTDQWLQAPSSAGIASWKISWELSWGTTYTLEISYHLFVPENYISFIQALEKRYAVTLWVREREILWLLPDWWTRGVVYFPPQARILNVTGTLSESNIFATPFSHNAYYVSSFSGNDMTSTIRIGFKM